MAPTYSQTNVSSDNPTLSNQFHGHFNLKKTVVLQGQNSLTELPFVSSCQFNSIRLLGGSLLSCPKLQEDS